MVKLKENLDSHKENEQEREMKQREEERNVQEKEEKEKEMKKKAEGKNKIEQEGLKQERKLEHHTIEAPQAEDTQRLQGSLIIGLSPEEQDQVLKIFNISSTKWRVTRTPYWREALEILERCLFKMDMIVFDWDMLGKVAFELIERLKANLSTEYIHIIVVGSDTSEGDFSPRQRCTKLGVEFLPKQELIKLDEGQSHVVTIDDGIGSIEGSPSKKKEVEAHKEEVGAKILNMGGILVGIGTAFFVFEGLILNSTISTSVECSHSQRWLSFCLCLLGGSILLSSLFALGFKFKKWLEEMDCINLGLEKITEDKLKDNKVLRDLAFWTLTLVFMLIAALNGVASALRTCPSD